MSIRVLLADDHQIMREGLRALLEKRSGFEVVGEACDGQEALSMAARLSPDVIVMDVGMTGLNGIDATRQVRATQPGIRVVALSMHAERRFVLGMLEAGASGYVVKDGALDELTTAIESVVDGGTYISPRVAGFVVERFLTGADEPPSAQDDLTPREREVLQLVAEGLTSKEIAARLFISARTVETHRRSLMEKLGARNVAQLTRYAIREGFSPDER